MNEQEKEIARKWMNAYQREWRRKNPEKVRATNERYWMRRVMKMLAEQEKGGEKDAEKSSV